MHIGDCRLWLNEGHDVAKQNVTPAEVLVLRKMHRFNTKGKDPVQDLVVKGQIVRSNAKEVARLRATYHAQDKKGVRIVDGLFPGVGGEGIPETFEGVWPAPIEKQENVELSEPGAALSEEIKPIEDGGYKAMPDEDTTKTPETE